MRKPDFASEKTKAQISFEHLAFSYTDSTIPLLHIAKISSFQLSSVTDYTGWFCWTW